MVATDRRTAGEAAVLAAIADMPDEDRIIATKLHKIIAENAPNLVPRTWYGMPSYGDVNGKVVCFLRSTKKFGERYMTLGFNDLAKLDDGNIWPISFAIKHITRTEETMLAALVRRAVN